MRSTPRWTRRLSALGLVALALGTGCDEEPAAPGYEPAPEKYAALPDDGPVDLSIPPDAILAGEVWVEVDLGQSRRFVLTKEAGKHYTIGLSQLDADLDLFGHWLPDVSRSVYQFVSWAFAIEDEQIDFTASEDGDYYIAVHGYERGRGLLQVYVSEPTVGEDEVIWPVEWGADEAGDWDLLAGGLDWLERYDYGAGCGLTHHPGIDMNHGQGPYGDLGLPIVAVSDGVVSGVGRDHPGWGNVVTIEHTLSNGVQFESLYGHVDDIEVEEGQRVGQGQRIASVGAPPTSTPHLHFEIRRNLGLGTFSFPCGAQPYTVEEAYDDPKEFIRRH
ncbi:MAG: M23 family metallopeptidase [Myxococcota bacterium]